MLKKLSDRVPDFPMTFWLKELAQLVEAIDQREQEENRYLRARIAELSARLDAQGLSDGG